MTTPAEPAAEIPDKDRVIAHLTQTLAHTRDCLEKARVALESIAAVEGEDSTASGLARCRVIALEALQEI